MNDSAFPPPAPRSQTYRNHNEFGVREALTAIRRGRLLWVTFTLAGLLLGGVAAYMAPGKYEANAFIQVATFANLPVESPASLAEKMKLPLFYSDEVYAACGLADSSAPGEDLVSILQPVVNRFAPMVGVSFVARAPAEAEQCLAGVLRFVQGKQAELAKPLINVNKAQLAELKSRYEEVKQLADQLSAKSAELATRPAVGTTANALLPTLSAAKQELRELGTEISKLEIALSPSQTRATEFATPVYVKNVRTNFKRATYVVAGTMAGLFFGIALVLTAAVWRSIVEKSQ